MNFLETITFLGSDVLVPIGTIKYIMKKQTSESWEITIKGEGEFEWVEVFTDEEKANIRYENIKKIVIAR